MNPIRLLANITAKGVDLIGSQGGGCYTKDEQIGALRGLDSESIDYLFAKYQSDEAALARLCWSRPSTNKDYSKLTYKMLELAQGWKIREKRQDKLRSLLNLVIFESLDPHCPTCKGTMYYRTKPCNTCSDNPGRYKLKPAQRAKAIGVDRKNWKPWEDRHAELTKAVQMMESRALRIIFKNMTESV